jgi:hypothetical protein
MIDPRAADYATQHTQIRVTQTRDCLTPKKRGVPGRASIGLPTPCWMED